MKLNKASLMVVIVAIALLAGCIGPIGEPPVITGMIADNELGLYAVSFKAWIDGPVTLQWETGDGTTLNGDNPTHDYGQPGNYIVTLTATDASGQSSRAELLVMVSYNVVCFPQGEDIACLYPQTREDREL